MDRTDLVLKHDRCRCPTCGEYFNSTYAFDKHRSGEWERRFCRSPDQMATLGMVKNNRGFWVSSRCLWRPNGRR
jgi:hypothetical protein